MNVQQKIDNIEAKREIVEHLLGLEENERVAWLGTQDGRYRMYQHYTTEELKNKEEQLSQELT